MIDSDDHDPYLDAIYVEGTDRLKPQVIVFFATTWSITGLAVLYGLYKLIYHVVARVRWRRHCRRVGCAGRHQLVTTTRVNHLRQTGQPGSNIEIPGLFAPVGGSLDFNNNPMALIPRGSMSVQMMTETPTHAVYHFGTTQFQTNSESRLHLQKLKASDFNIFNELQVFDANNNRIRRFVHPIIFPVSVETEFKIVPTQEETGIEPVEIDEEPENVSLEIEEQPLERTKVVPIDESEMEPDTDDVNDRKLSDNSKTTSVVASALGIVQRPGPSPNPSAYIIPETYVRAPGPSLVQQIKAIPMPSLSIPPIPIIPAEDVLEYSQADGGWYRKKIENYVPAPSHKYTFPKEQKMLGSGYIGRIFEPINRFITSVISPDPSSTTIDVPDCPARFDLSEYEDVDQNLIRQKIQRLTRIRSSMGLVSFFNLIQGEGSLRLEELVVVPSPQHFISGEAVEQPIEAILSAPSSTVSKLPEYDPESETPSKPDLVEVVVSSPKLTNEANAEPTSTVSSSSTSVSVVKRDENIKTIQTSPSQLSNPKKSQPRKCCCC